MLHNYGGHLDKPGGRASSRLAAAILAVLIPSADTLTAVECVYRSDARTSSAELWHRISVDAEQIAPSSRRRSVVPREPMPRNFIDEEIFGKMRASGIRWTGISSDSEYLRRVYLDLTGQIPTSETVKRFLADDR
ncbi:MAG TPA: DUF1549 domain-containing protein, partial [Thermoanaerobaculia bacterium]|nr:DUF1549 domain-containing protein [Thermoanaerobaculia bacterium]